MKVGTTMKHKALSNLAASPLIVATSMVGCTGQALHTQAGASAGKLATMADAQARDAEKALAHYQRSLEISENLLSAHPDSAEAARDVSVCLNKLGDFHSTRGQPWNP